MSNIFELPDRMHRQWQIYEGRLREVYLEAAADPDELAHVLEQIKPAFMESARPLTFRPNKDDPDAGVRIVNDYVAAITSGLLFRILELEIELYRLRGRPKPQPENETKTGAVVGIANSSPI